MGQAPMKGFRLLPRQQKIVDAALEKWPWKRQSDIYREALECLAEKEALPIKR